MLLKRSVALLLTFATLLTMPCTGFAASVTEQTLYTTASDWAKPEIMSAYDAGLIPAGLLNKKATEPATREELCELAVLLYEKTTGKTAVPASPDPFTDTTNPAILKAYALGITTGTSATTFSPNDKTNREQVATMFGRAIRTMFPGGDYGTAGAPVFTDQADISSWALEHVLYMSKAGIIKGANGAFMPRAITDAQKTSGYGTTTREQAVAITVRISGLNINTSGGEEEFAQSLIRTSAGKPTEALKLAAIDFDSRVFRPIYRPVIALSAQSAPGSDTMSAAPFTAVVSHDDPLATFKLSMRAGTVSQAAKIVWQVSLVPFSGAPVTNPAVKPGGLLLSGELSTSASSFTLDFSKINAAQTKLMRPSEPPVSLSAVLLLPTVRPNVKLPTLTGSWLLTHYGTESATALRTYYVRVYPADALGKSIGDAGAGLPVLYGDPMAAKSSTLININTYFALQLADKSGEVYYTTEFPNKFYDATEKALVNTINPAIWSVLPSGYPDGTQELRIQVSLTDFAVPASDSWRSVPGLVYEKTLRPGDAQFDALQDAKPLGISIDFDEFVPPDDKLPEGEYLRYYIRAVSLTDGAQAGTAKAHYSKTVKIIYGIDNSPGIKFLENVKITPPIPVIEKLTYVPVQWESENWQYHYVVTRQPTMKDVFGPLIGSDAPYKSYAVGTKLDFTPQPENKSWWEEAWDAISDFFGSMTNFLAKIVNWVSTAYADLKSGLIEIVVSALPSDLQGPLRTALTAMVDYGLASIGIPPTLPNFDQLANLGTDYLATMALQQAGVPAGSLTEYGVDVLSDQIGSNLSSSADASSPNPMNWDFVQLDPDDLYRPAYLLVELYNNTGIATPAGHLSFTADKFMDLSKNGTDPAVTRLYAVYGSSYVCLYKPVFGMEIPAMEPGQRLTVPVILEEYVGVPFPGCSASVLGSDYASIYGGLGAFDFNLFIQYELPPIAQEAARQGHTEEAIYSYSALGSGRSFSIEPSQGYSK